MEKNIYDAYVDILKEELIPAMGCTEPIAVAYAGALARKALGALPERVILCVSGNIVKNVKSVIVPHTGGRKGLKVAVAVGICCGDADQELEVISGVTEQQLKELDQYLEQVEVKITESTANCPFDIQVTAYHGDDCAYARIIGHHTNVVSVKKNDNVLVDVPFQDDVVQAPENRKLLSVENIVKFADEVKIERMEFMLSADDTAIYAAYNAGNLDFADTVPTDEIQSLLDNPEFHIIDNLGTYYVAFNVNSDLFAGKTPEQASAMTRGLTLLIDRDYIVENIGQTGQQLLLGAYSALSRHFDHMR